eukprot:TRINITY_DN25640_c0_g1_i1.p1 TRINITY_DN25640_c0_g1~~TRINITY_DN25640_c0_g1_i1.p1  ORF type:complete len:137 (+),score=16.03 TRINITY_DN25640_c0_g1_i1:134-544(+)
MSSDELRTFESLLTALPGQLNTVAALMNISSVRARRLHDLVKRYDPMARSNSQHEFELMKVAYMEGRPQQCMSAYVLGVSGKYGACLPGDVVAVIQEYYGRGSDDFKLQTKFCPEADECEYGHLAVRARRRRKRKL